MMIESLVRSALIEVLSVLYDQAIPEDQINFQKTRKEFEGDLTFVVFPFAKMAKKSPEATANEIGAMLQKQLPLLCKYNAVQGFLNMSIVDSYWLNFLYSEVGKPDFGFSPLSISESLVVEYSSPNTNKPLHLGHIRNNLLGWSIAEIKKANGYEVKKVNLVNDRGIHICKSMLAWQKFGNGETPDSTGMKGDHFVGKYYVAFDKAYKQQLKSLVENGMAEEEANKHVPILEEAQVMLLKWEQKDPEIIGLWKMMNTWVYQGFEQTYKKMGVDFDKIYYESDTYLLGKEIVNQGLKKGVLFQKEDGSVWADLSDQGLDQKLLLRADGTSVYMTQDLGTALLRHDDFHSNKLVYVVGNEQNYHFEVLKIILNKLGYEWADKIFHLSYGMVELPEGKMKSREGTVVDADDLMEEMIETAKMAGMEHGKNAQFTEQEAEKLYSLLAMGALKYFILKVDPTKNILFNPKESIDFNGNTGPFIQYTYARIRSLYRKSVLENRHINTVLDPKVEMNKRERDLLRLLYDFPSTVFQAGEIYSPALIANYVFELAKLYNTFYQETPIFKEERSEIVSFRLYLSFCVADILKRGMGLLGIEMPERM